MDTPLSNKERLINFFYTIYRRKYLILLSFIIIYLGIVSGTWLSPQYYKASTRILIHTNPKQEISLFPDLAKPGERDSRVNLAHDLAQILTGEDLGRKVVSSFHLDELYFKRKNEPEELRDIVWYYIHKTIDVIKSPYTYSKLLLVHLGFLSPEQEENYSYSALEEFLDDWLDVKPESEARVINLSIWGPEPRLASDIASRMAELLVERTLNITREQAMVGYKFTASQLRGLENKYYSSQEKLKRFMEENNIVSLDSQKNTLISSNDKFETLLAENEANLMGTIKKAGEIRKKLALEQEKIMSSTVTGNNPILMELKSQLKDEEISLKSAIVEKSDQHLDIKKIRAEIYDIKEKIKKEENKIVISEQEDINPIHQDLNEKLLDLESHEVFLKEKNNGLRITISEIKKTLDSIPKKEMELKRLETEVDIYADLYSNVKDKLEKLLVLKANEINQFGLSIINKSNLPENISPTWPDWNLNTLYIGIPLSIFIAFFIGFFVDYWIDIFSTKKEVEFCLELPVIGEIPKIKRKKTRILLRDSTDKINTQKPITYEEVYKNILSPEIYPDQLRDEDVTIMRDHLIEAYIAKSNSPAAISFGIIADNLCWNNLLNRNDKVYLITSASFREGKTTLAVNLALHLAKRRKKVLLIDANFRNPEISKIFETEGIVGLTQIVCNNLPIKHFSFPDEEYIHFIPSGKIDCEPFNILTSQKLKETFEEAKRLYDFVIIDCTAANFYADPLLLWPSVDQGIFVVMADKTEKNDVLIAKAKIKNAEGKILGVVFNKGNHFFL